jgi:hypothetical protein
LQTGNRWSSERRAKLACALPSRDRGRAKLKGGRIVFVPHDKDSCKHIFINIKYSIKTNKEMNRKTYTTPTMKDVKLQHTQMLMVSGESGQAGVQNYTKHDYDEWEE